MQERAAAHECSWTENEINVNRPFLSRWIALEKQTGLEQANQKALELAAELDSEEEPSFELNLLRAYIAGDRKDYVAAQRLLDAALKAPDEDWGWVAEQSHAMLAELRGDDATAIQRYRTAISQVEKLRKKSSFRSAHFVSSHRGPYDGLISLYARKGEWRAALEVILELDATDMLHAMTSHPGAKSASERASVEAVLEAWRGRHLVIAFAPKRREIGGGQEKAYVLELRDGDVTGRAIGDARAVLRFTAELHSAPEHEESAVALGALLVPPGGSDAPLDVLGLGELSQIPLGALRDTKGSLSSLRYAPRRVSALWTSVPETAGDARAVIVADAEENLPGAAKEGQATRESLLREDPHRSVRLCSGKQAKLTCLQEAQGADLLYFASHINWDAARGPVLPLADDSIAPEELVNWGAAPRVAVLAACWSAKSTDAQWLGSFAAAFIEAGSVHVLAADRQVNDKVTAAMMSAIRAQPDWQQRPAQALARAQQAAAGRQLLVDDEPIEPRLWAAFTVLTRPPYLSRPRTP
jgi:hypothetical protein